MPKTAPPSMQNFINIRINQNGQEIGIVQLPSFCVDHMRMTSPELNLTTMIKHIQSRCGGITVNKVFVNGELRHGLTADEMNGLILDIE